MYDTLDYLYSTVVPNLFSCAVNVKNTIEAHLTNIYRYENI